MVIKPRKITNPSLITIVQIGKDSDNKGKNFYMAFDEQGDMVNLQIKKLNTPQIEKIDYKHSTDENTLRDLGFENIKKKSFWSLFAGDEIEDYLDQKELRLYPDCHCLVKKKQLLETGCIPSDCIEPKKTIIFEEKPISLGEN